MRAPAKLYRIRATAFGGCFGFPDVVFVPTFHGALGDCDFRRTPLYWTLHHRERELRCQIFRRRPLELIKSEASCGLDGFSMHDIRRIRETWPG
jgi:hypothetical protein